MSTTNLYEWFSQTFFNARLWKIFIVRFWRIKPSKQLAPWKLNTSKAKIESIEKTKFSIFKCNKSCIATTKHSREKAIFVTVQRQANLRKTDWKCLHLQLCMRANLFGGYAHRRNAKHFGGWSWRVTKNKNWSSKKEHKENALALGADERRGKLRKASGRRKQPSIRRYLNGETYLSKPQVSIRESIAYGRERCELKHLSSSRRRKKTRFPK